MKRRQQSSLELHDGMSRAEIAAALDRMVFTATRDWLRTVSMDRNVRDLIVRSLRSVQSKT